MIHGEIRPAQGSDFPAIATIHNIHAYHPEKDLQQGFLLREITVEDLQTQSQKNVQYYVKVDSSGQILGFVSVYRPQIPADFLTQLIWLEPSYQEDLVQPENLAIQTIGIHPDCVGKGIGREFYQFLDQTYPDNFFTAFVVNQPVCNTSSLAFHQKLGFKAIAKSQSCHFLNFNNYESLLLLREKLSHS